MQVVASALDGARYRRERLEQMRGLSSSASSRSSTPATPDSMSTRSSVKRNLKGDGNPPSASTAASSSTGKDMVEKVTPDPKHVRVDVAPTPKQLFASPGENGNHGGCGLAKTIHRNPKKSHWAFCITSNPMAPCTV